MVVVISETGTCSEVVSDEERAGINSANDFQKERRNGMEFH